MRNAREAAMRSMKHALDLQAKYYNKRRLQMQFAEGQEVLLSAKNIRTKRPHKKLDAKFLGPFKILQCIGQQSYKLDLPPSMSRLHPVFHAQLLESYTMREGFQPPAVELLDDGEQWEVEKIVAQQVRRGLPQFLIKWKGWSNEHNTWLFETDLNNCQEVLEEYKATAVARPPPVKRRRRAAVEQTTTTTDAVPVMPKKRGRPKGSKNKPKT
jgi:hypothetical protein